MNKKLIIFEGLPGGGKTTLAKKMAETLGGEYVEEIIQHKKFSPNQDEYYAESELIKMRKFSQSDRRLVFLDRSFYSMMAYNYGKKMIGANHATRDLNNYLVSIADIIESGLFVYLRIDDINLCNKRKGRKVDKNNVWTRGDALAHIRDFYDELFKKKRNKIIINTDNRTLDEVYELLVNKLKKYV